MSESKAPSVTLVVVPSWNLNPFMWQLMATTTGNFDVPVPIVPLGSGATTRDFLDNMADRQCANTFSVFVANSNIVTSGWWRHIDREIHCESVDGRPHIREVRPPKERKRIMRSAIREHVQRHHLNKHVLPELVPYVTAYSANS